MKFCTISNQLLSCCCILFFLGCSSSGSGISIDEATEDITKKNSTEKTRKSKANIALPNADFNRTFRVAVDVSSAEHCRENIDKQLVRTKFFEFESRQGLTQAQFNNLKDIYDRIFRDYKKHMRGDPQFCSTTYQKKPDRLKEYEIGSFPDIKFG